MYFVFRNNTKDKSEIMESILNHLKQHIIVSSKDIQTLQQSLLIQHPDFSNEKRAQLFAKTLHHTLNKALNPFTGTFLKSLKQLLLQQALLKESFSIDAFDIFCAYTQITTPDETQITMFTSWINHYQPSELSITEVNSLIIAFTSDIKFSSDLIFQPPTVSSLIKQNRWLLLISASLVIICSSLLTNKPRYAPTLRTIKIFPGVCTITPLTLPSSLKLSTPTNDLQPYLQYKKINIDALKLWLNQRHSLLATEPYFTTILDTSETFNINPLLLFAITGQEQNFVPSTHEYATEIANNPFNLYGSWKEYNTSIEEASQIAARTIINLSKDCPEYEDQIKWINRLYAEDPNWHQGVSYFLNELELATTFETPKAH